MKVIIIGAGASGLMAANVLSKQGVSVIVLEAQSRIGGRIHTLYPDGFTNHVEAGAEFIHGNLPLTLQLMKKAKLAYVPTAGKMYRLINRELRSDFGQTKAWETFYKTLQNLKKDCTLEAFVANHFAAKSYEKLRQDVYDMAQGLDLADVSQLSVLSIREEWLSEEQQYRPLTGYAPLLEFLRNDAVSKQYQIHLNECVSCIQWQKGAVIARTQKSDFTADAIIVSVSAGNFQKDSITFKPSVSNVSSLFNDIGFGHVIKLALEFDYAFWEKEHPDLGFLFTEQGFTFWTQLSQHKPLLTGWIGNDYVSQYKTLSDKALLHLAIEKLQKALGLKAAALYKSGAVFRYGENSSSGGGYSWLKPESKPAIRKINKGIENTVWFAGEALHPGTETGTVEAALQSGRYTARQILKNIKE